MGEKDDLDLTDLGMRRWVRYLLPVLVCVDTDEAGDQQVRHVVPLLEDIGTASDDLRNPVVYDPDGTERVTDHREDEAAWQAISYAGAMKDTWVGEKPWLDWDWLESTEELTADDRDIQDGVDDEPEDDEPEDDELEWTPTR